MEDDDQLPKSKSETQSNREDEQGGGDLPDRHPESRRRSSRSLETNRELDEESYEATPVEDDSIEGKIVPAGNSTVQREFSTFYEHSGPLPPVSAFRGYEEILPGSADRILRMAEEGIAIERKQVESNAAIQHAVARSVDGNTKRAGRQQIIYAALTFIVIACAFALAWADKPVPAVLALIVAFAPGFMLFDMYRKAPPILPTDTTETDNTSSE